MPRLDKLIFFSCHITLQHAHLSCEYPPPSLLSNIVLGIALANHDVDASKIDLVDMAQTGVEYILYG